MENLKDAMNGKIKFLMHFDYQIFCYQRKYHMINKAKLYKIILVLKKNQEEKIIRRNSNLKKKKENNCKTNFIYGENMALLDIYTRKRLKQTFFIYFFHV